MTAPIRSMPVKDKYPRTLTEACEMLVKDLGDCQTVIGPCCWKPVDGTVSKQWYFMVSGCTKTKTWWTDQVSLPPEWQQRDFLELMRRDFIGLMFKAADKRGIKLILHDFGDELPAIKMCEILWPGARVTKIREAVERELNIT